MLTYNFGDTHSELLRKSDQNPISGLRWSTLMANHESSLGTVSLNTRFQKKKKKRCEMLLLQTASGTTRSWACLSNWLLDVIVSKLKWTVCLQSSQSLRDGHQSSSSIIPGLDHTMHQQSWAGLNESKSRCAAHNKQLLASELQGCGSIANTANLMYTRSVRERFFFGSSKD